MEFFAIIQSDIPRITPGPRSRLANRALPSNKFEWSHQRIRRGCPNAYEEEFAAFEALPADLRDVLNYAPVKLTATTVIANGWKEGQGIELRKAIQEMVNSPDFKVR